MATARIHKVSSVSELKYQTGEVAARLFCVGDRARARAAGVGVGGRAGLGCMAVHLCVCCVDACTYV